MPQSDVLRGRLWLDLSDFGTVVRAQHDATEGVVGRGPSPVIHDQMLVLNETRLSGEYGVVDGFAIALMIPLRVVGAFITYRDQATSDPVDLAAPNIHHRNETLTGFGDFWLNGRLSLRRAGLALEVRFGVTLPVGQVQPDPFALGDAGLQHEHIQLGNGTVNPLVGVEAYRVFDKWSIGGWALAMPVLYA